MHHSMGGANNVLRKKTYITFLKVYINFLQFTYYYYLPIIIIFFIPIKLKTRYFIILKFNQCHCNSLHLPFPINMYPQHLFLWSSLNWSCYKLLARIEPATKWQQSPYCWGSTPNYPLSIRKKKKFPFSLLR